MVKEFDVGDFICVTITQHRKVFGKVVGFSSQYVIITVHADVANSIMHYMPGDRFWFSFIEGGFPVCRSNPAEVDKAKALAAIS